MVITLRLRHEHYLFLGRILTVDVKWIIYDKIRHKVNWKYVFEFEEQVTTMDLQPLKILLPVWCEQKGIIHFEILPDGEKITANKHCDQLANAAIQEKRPILSNRKDVILNYNKTSSQDHREFKRDAHQDTLRSP